MANFFGWKDILRPIRDGYRHLFPTPGTGPSPEERRKQRQKDLTKGFTYFDTFEQLESWTAEESEPFQRTNFPLVPRAKSESDLAEGKSEVVLIHDYSGNYHDYESVQDIVVEEQMYACEYLQFVSTFIYFSHKLVCVPPPTWTDVLHRNGVLSLGTILLEPQTEQTERLLGFIDTDGAREYLLASKLSEIADHYGFDGWLLNIEKPFPQDAWNIASLQTFCSQLRDFMGPKRRLIWFVVIFNCVDNYSEVYL